ncbi:MAG: DUF1624 domain-containing protein [Candidatus Omnitrophica bacterium]|nr:DUF1624 domain-containing protein [Candidatus Omnitrophota bacterium]
MENRKRYLSIDLLKAIGIITVIVAQPIVGMFVVDDQGGLRYAQARRFLEIFFRTGVHFFPFMLATLAAMTFFVYVNNKNIGWGKVLKRAFILSMLGFLMNSLAWGLEDAIDWDVLQFVALSMVISYPFVKRFSALSSKIGLMILGMTALFFSNIFPLLQFRHFYLYSIIFGDFWGENYWPFFPWFSIFVLGIFLGYLFDRNSPKIRLLPWMGIVLFLASAFSGNLFTVFDDSNVWGPAIFKPSPFFMSGLIGFYLMVIPALHMSVERYPRIKSFLLKTPLKYYALAILWIYILTVVIGFRITRFAFSLKEPSLGASIAILAFLVICNLLLGYFLGRSLYLRKKPAY